MPTTRQCPTPTLPINLSNVGQVVPVLWLNSIGSFPCSVDTRPVKQFGGTVPFQSRRRQSHNTLFLRRFLLPNSKTHSIIPPSSRQKEFGWNMKNPGNTALRVLIADDHPLFRSAIKSALFNQNRQTEFVEAGFFDELCEKLDQEQDLDLILLDLKIQLMHPQWIECPSLKDCFFAVVAHLHRHERVWFTFQSRGWQVLCTHNIDGELPYSPPIASRIAFQEHALGREPKISGVSSVCNPAIVR